MLLAIIALALSGCFMAPGKFTSQLDLTGADRFTFTYDGEIFFLGLSKLALMGAGSEEAFKASCIADDSFEERACTPQEEAETAPPSGRPEPPNARPRKTQEAEQMAAIMGGINPTDPGGGRGKWCACSNRQKGWNRVVHKGDGLFEVSYSVSGTLGHDFMFPTIEGFPATNPFVQMILRDGGQVRINAPGFAATERRQSDGWHDGRHGLACRAGRHGRGKNRARVTRRPGRSRACRCSMARSSSAPRKGMRILANNTDEGPAGAPQGGETVALGNLSAHCSGPDRADRDRRMTAPDYRIQTIIPAGAKGGRVRCDPRRAIRPASRDQFTASFRPLPALNLGWFEALIFISSPRARVAADRGLAFGDREGPKAHQPHFIPA